MRKIRIYFWALAAFALTNAQAASAEKTVFHNYEATALRRLQAPASASENQAETAPRTNAVRQMETPGRTQPFASLHLGFLLDNPGLEFGLDLTLPRVRLLPGFVTRIDADVLAPFSAPSFLGQPDTHLDLIFCQTRYFSGQTGKRFYAGGGLGIFYGEVTQFGGKLYVGKELTNVVGLEAALHLAVSNNPQVSLQFRIGL